MLNLIKTALRRQSRPGSFGFTSHPSLIAVLTLLLAVFLPLSLHAYDFQECKDCHTKSLAGDAAVSHRHSPFIQQNCGACHLASIEKAKPLALVKKGNIDWLAETGVAAPFHAFLLPASKLGDTLVVQLYGQAGEFTRRIIAIPSLVNLAAVEDSGKAPEVSEVRVLKVERRALISATIGWTTNTLADASVRYGTDDRTQTAGPGKRFARHHQVLLANLQSGQTYRFTVVSRDLFGRSTVAGPLTFSTAEPLTPTRQQERETLPGEGEKDAISINFKRCNADYLVELTLPQPASATIGKVGETRCLPDDEAHAGLSCGEAVAIKACLDCHRGHAHPLKVAPQKQATVIPPEFPTLSGGRITCSSCHEPHGSNNVNLMRKPTESELCASCHLKNK